jgi:predicted nucleic acid-binding protein
MSSFTAVYDACVLYPAPLRDLLMRLAMTDLFRARWTEEIHKEWINSVLRDRPDLSYDQLNRTRELMNLHVRDCLVENYQDLIQGLSLPDPDDRHVLAAAIKCNAGVIVTFNLSDFPDVALAPYGIEAQHPDDFVVHLIDLDAEAVATAVIKQFRSLKNPPYNKVEFLAAIKRSGLVKTVEELEEFGRLRGRAGDHG